VAAGAPESNVRAGVDIRVDRRRIRLLRTSILKVPPWPQACRCPSAGSRPLCPARCEIRSTSRTSSPALLPVHRHRRSDTLSRLVIEFLSEVREHFPFAIQKIQTDNDSSFGPQFTWHLSDLSISHHHIPPGCPEVNGKVERSHKTDAEEFYRAKRFRNKRDLARKLKRWETEYNENRPHLALEGKTPAERVRELAQPSEPVRDLS
jgi:hypothetical protein